MSLSQIEAGTTLSIIEATSRESRIRFGYRRAAPHTIGWGLTWALGYIGTAALAPDAANNVWLGLITTMVIASGVIMHQQSGGARSIWRIALCAALPSIALILLVNVVGYVFNLTNITDYLLLYCLIVAGAYVAFGARLGWRYAATGFAIIAITAAGTLLIPAKFLIGVFMLDAALLVSSGLWLRRA